MEARGSMRSLASTASKRRKSTKVIRYSARALAQFILVATGVFVALALLGLSVQAYRSLKGNSATMHPKPTPNNSANVANEESLSSMAFAATVVALRLWGKLILSILIPTTEHSLVYAKEGWGALEPSLKQSAFWFVFETSPMFKLGVFLSLCAFFLIWLLEREIKRRRIVERISARIKRVTDKINAVKEGIQIRYARVKAEVERESRIAAQLLPHVLFTITIGLAMLVFPDLMYTISRGFGGWAIIVGWPVLLSTRRMLQHDEVREKRLKEINNEGIDLSSSEEETSSNDGDDRSTSTPIPEGFVTDRPAAKKAQMYLESVVQTFRRRLLSDASISPSHVTYGLSNETIGDFDPITEWLRYWSVLSVCLFIEQFPISGHILSVIPIWPEIRLAFALWLQLPITRGCDWAFSAVVPLLDKYVKKIPALQIAQNQMSTATTEQRGFVVTILSSLGIVSKKTGKKLLKATEMNGTLLMVAFPFMLSPSFVTKIGVLIVGLAFPAHASTTCVLELDQLKSDIKKRDRAVTENEDGQAAAHSDAGEQSVFWLEYWVVYVLFSLVHAPLATIFGWWFPLWDQFHLALLLWMQISYFSGAKNIFNIAVVIGRVWRRRRQAALKRRRRTSSVAGPQEKFQTIVEALPFISPVVRAPSPLETIDTSVRDEDENTDEDQGHDGNLHLVREMGSVELNDRVSAREGSDATIAHELNLDAVIQEPESGDKSSSSSGGDDFIAIEKGEADQ